MVLGYTSNESRRFHVFMAKRVQEIQNSTSLEQWNHVESKQNPADEEELDVLMQITQKSPDPNNRVFVQQRKTNLKTYSSLYKLDPFVDAHCQVLSRTHKSPRQDHDAE